MTLNRLLITIRACRDAREEFAGLTPDEAYAWIVERTVNEGFVEKSIYSESPVAWMRFFTFTVLGYTSTWDFSTPEESEIFALMFLDWITQDGNTFARIKLPPRKRS